MLRKAASENLTPVTLELGGKCPAILTAKRCGKAVRDLLATKMVKNGQMCISVDYVLVPEAQLEQFGFARSAARWRR